MFSCQINQHLDKYIVGQEKAKKTLSVAVFNHYHRIVHSREQAQAARDRESAAVAAAESLAEAEAELESSKKPETVMPTPVKRRKTRDTAEEEQEQRRIESRVVEPDPTKIHEPSTWTGTVSSPSMLQIA
jgi:ATP-dependent Clp protease ATP-binding subunit ClpX